MYLFKRPDSAAQTMNLVRNAGQMRQPHGE